MTLKLLKELEDVTPATSSAGTYAAVVTNDGMPHWEPGLDDNFSCNGGTVTGESSSGGFINWRSDLTLSGSYSLRGEFRLLKTFQEGWSYGIVFGAKWDVRSKWVLMISRGNEVLLAEDPDEQPGFDFVKTQILVNYNPKKWHSLRLDVRPGKATFFLDDWEVFTYEGDGPDAFAGDIGMFIQSSRVEIRNLGVRR